MKNTTTFDNFKQIVKDKVFLAMFIVGSLISLIAALLISISIKTSEIQLVSHYTAFNQVGFFRNQWQYLIVFAIFPLTSWLLNSLLAFKMYIEKDRRFGVVLLGVGLMITLIAFIIARSVLNVASLV